MTFSVIAIDSVSGDLGIAVASKILAVGSFVPHAIAEIGAVATQSFANLNYATDGLCLMSLGYSPKEIIIHVTSKDPEASIRQVAMINAQGEVFAFTGKNCVPWTGHYIGENYIVLGNMLTGPEVLEFMRTTWENLKPSNYSFPEKLLITLEAGEVAGGDKRGKQSAAILVVRKNGGYGGFNDRLIDLRVDHSENPLIYLRKALEYKLKYRW